MGAGASVPEKVDLATAKELAGDAFEEAKFNALKDEDGFITREQMVAALKNPESQVDLTQSDLPEATMGSASPSLAASKTTSENGDSFSHEVAAVTTAEEVTEADASDAEKATEAENVAAAAAAADAEEEEASRSALEAKVSELWSSLEKDEDGSIERLKCWVHLLADRDLAALLSGDGDAARGRRVLEAMKAARALDVDGDGRIKAAGFRRLIAQAVVKDAEALLEEAATPGAAAGAAAGVTTGVRRGRSEFAAAALRFKVGSLWSSVLPRAGLKSDAGEPTGTVEREACWRLIFIDAELASMVGGGNCAAGLKVLRAMKKARALDVDGDGEISEAEFQNLLNHERFYSYHPEDHAQKLKHLSSAGDSAAALLKELKTPPGLLGADLVLYKLAQKIGLDSDGATSGFGSTHHPGHVNYFKMFQQMDQDRNREIELEEFNQAIRKTLGIGSPQCSDAELLCMFGAMDGSGNGKVTLKEFAAFARGAGRSSAYHGELAVFQQRGGASPEHSGAEPAAAGQGLRTQGHLLYHDVEVDPTKLAMPKGLNDKADVQDAVAQKQSKQQRKARQGGKQLPGGGLEAVDLVLWHLSQHVARATDSAHSTGNALKAQADYTHPGHVSYQKLFKALDLDMNGIVTRDEWAITLRRHVGVGSRHVSDGDLELFDEIDTRTAAAPFRCASSRPSRGVPPRAPWRGGCTSSSLYDLACASCSVLWDI